ncbi:ATP-binding protein [Cohnella algarum]|uniref:hybrid sensor histidine kinase/response regulator n=1 Tax=Cohnella algarum TaxID=2044859 RepID=UPI0019684322|nr:ATP-binding protein [Cohnella algarum]MBN2980964.1 response regulator [Cohnella algarum]
MIKTRTKSILKYTAVILLFVAVLFGLRLAWSHFFYTPEHPPVVRGVLDMRDWDFDTPRSIPLDGEWEFYPDALLSHEDFKEANPEPRYANVPGDWSAAFPDDSGGSSGLGGSYGYGTYRLRILIDSPDQPLGFWFPRIQSSSTVEINGQPEALFGRPAEDADAYVPEVSSYTATYIPDGAEEIELLIRAANYDHPYDGGIVRSVRFGSQAAIDTERWYSIGFQLATFFILMLHGLYAFILYLFKPRERTFLVFFLLLLAAGTTIVSDHDFVLQLWLPFDFAWMVKIRLLSYMWLSFFMLRMALKFSALESPSLTRWVRIYTAVLLLYSGFLAVAPASLVYVTREWRVFSVLYLAPLIWSAYLFWKMFSRNKNDGIFLLLAATGVFSSAFWGIFIFNRVYYPIDIIAAIIGFSTYWFKRYFRNAEENAKLNEQLLAADKRKDRFLAHTSHELRTPLHGMMSIAQSVAIKEKESMDGKSAEDMQLLVTIGRRMSHLLDDLLDVVRLREKRIILQKKPISLSSVASGVIDMLNYLTEGKPVRLKSEIKDSFPPALADEKRLVQILYNLVHNAIKHTEEGTVAVSAEIRNGTIAVRVTDTGSGMDEETQARIFLPYEQGPGDGGGIGLGLSISKELAELHGGGLTARSELGKGSTFELTLPLAEWAALPEASMPDEPVPPLAEPYAEVAAARSLADASAVGRTASPAASPPVGEHGATILIVDDDAVNLKVLAGILASEPYRIRSVTSAREALELLGAEPWDLIIADVMMPQMSGYELTQKVRKRFSASELPVLLLTARGEPADIYAGFRAGANDYVTKPVDAMELKYRIWSLTSLKRSVHEQLRLEAAYLQAQIQPHFLFNTLNSIMALSEIDSERMRKLGNAFTSYLRISFHFLNTGELVSLSHELDLVRAYLYIEKERFEDRLQVSWEVEPGIDFRLPPLTIQPLVENAVRHGVLRQADGGTVRIRIVRRERFALVEVIDDGAGMSEERIRELLKAPKKDKSGIGLSNTNRRLLQMYGKGLSVQSELGKGTTVSFEISDPG